jgi:ABC-type dipeptide/oligopeptide/nickel transport system ATPase component
MLPLMAREVDKVAISIVMNEGRQIIESAKTQHVNDGDVQQFTFELLECIDGVDNADRCHNCHTTSGDVRKRSRCKKVVYCSREYQKEDYKLHKKMCVQIASFSNAATRQRERKVFSASSTSLTSGRLASFYGNYKTHDFNHLASTLDETLLISPY